MKKRELIVSYTKKDFRIDTFCAGGPGGQHQNKTQSGIRITHLPTGLFSVCREHKSQGQNKSVAFKRLAELIKNYHKNLIVQERVKNEEIIRTYHEQDNRVTDHASGLKQSYTDIESDITPMIDARINATKGLII